jgi:hypothetical protein
LIDLIEELADDRFLRDAIFMGIQDSSESSYSDSAKLLELLATSAVGLNDCFGIKS